MKKNLEVKEEELLAEIDRINEVDINETNRILNLVEEHGKENNKKKQQQPMLKKALELG